MLNLIGTRRRVNRPIWNYNLVTFSFVVSLRNVILQHRKRKKILQIRCSLCYGSARQIRIMKQNFKYAANFDGLLKTLKTEQTWFYVTILCWLRILHLCAQSLSRYVTYMVRNPWREHSSTSIPSNFYSFFSRPRVLGNLPLRIVK